MVVQVIGIERKQGTFKSPKGEEIAYDNMYYYCHYVPDEKENADIVGVRTVDYKIKTEKIHDQIEVNDLIEVYFNQFRTPDMVCVVQKGDKHK